MTELSQPPQQPRSPEQRTTPTNVSKGHLNRWGNKIIAGSFGFSTAVNGLFSLVQFASGDNTHGFLFLSMAAGSAITAGFAIVTDRLVNRSQQKK